MNFKKGDLVKLKSVYNVSGIVYVREEYKNGEIFIIFKIDNIVRLLSLKDFEPYFSARDGIYKVEKKL